MPLTLLSGVPAIGMVGAVAAAGWAGQDCLLLAGSSVLAHRLFLVRMDRGAPWRALTAAANALTLGALTFAAGITLVAGVGAVALSWWHAAAPHPASTLPILVASAVWCCSARGSVAGALQEFPVWLWMLGGALLATVAEREGVAVGPCAFVFVVGLAMLWAGWHLASVTASALLRSGSETR